MRLAAFALILSLFCGPLCAIPQQATRKSTGHCHQDQRDTKVFKHCCGIPAILTSQTLILPEMQNPWAFDEFLPMPTGPSDLPSAAAGFAQIPHLAVTSILRI